MQLELALPTSSWKYKVKLLWPVHDYLSMYVCIDIIDLFSSCPQYHYSSREPYGSPTGQCHVLLSGHCQTSTKHHLVESGAEWDLHPTTDTQQPSH